MCVFYLTTKTLAVQHCGIAVWQDVDGCNSPHDDKFHYQEKLLEMNAALMRQSAAHKALDERRTVCSEQMRRQFEQVRCQLQVST